MVIHALPYAPSLGSYRSSGELVCRGGPGLVGPVRGSGRVLRGDHVTGQEHQLRPGLIAVAIGFAVAAAAVLSGFLRVHGFDWSAGSNQTYCGIYWPHLDAYCQSGH